MARFMIPLAGRPVKTLVSAVSFSCALSSASRWMGLIVAAIADYCRDKCGVVLGRGLGAHEGKAFRIAHMGHVNAPMIFGTLSVVEMALAALNVPHGRGGAQAAVEFLAKAVPA